MAKSIVFNAVLIASLCFLVSVAESQLIEARVTDANGVVKWYKRYAEPENKAPSPSSNDFELHTKSRGKALSPNANNIELLVCNKVLGVASGDTCTSVAKKGKLTASSFQAINPNLNCNKLFIGQWLCVEAITGA